MEISVTGEWSQTETWLQLGGYALKYFRSHSGSQGSSRWHQAAVRQKMGRIIAGGMTKEVTAEPVDGPINDRIDDAYLAKYQGSPHLSPMVGARTCSATAKVMPRE